MAGRTKDNNNKKSLNVYDRVSCLYTNGVFALWRTFFWAQSALELEFSVCILHHILSLCVYKTHSFYVHMVTNKNQHDTHTTRLDTFERMTVYEQTKEWNEQMYERANRTAKLNANRVQCAIYSNRTLILQCNYTYSVATIFELIFFKAHAYISIQMCLHV